MRFYGDGTTSADNSGTVKSTPVSRQPLERSWLTVWPIFFHGLGRSMGVNWSSEAIFLRVDHIIIYLTTNDAIVTYQHLRRHAKEAITCDKQQKGGIGRPEG